MKWGPQLLAAATLAYCVALIPILRADPWMWRVWIPSWLIFTLAAAIYVARRGRPAWKRAVLPWTGAIAFSIVAVMAAIMETRSFENVGRVFWALGFGMVGSVALFMMSYDRSKRAPAEAD